MIFNLILKCFYIKILFSFALGFLIPDFFIQIRGLLKARTEQDKKLQALEEEFKKTELKLVNAMREKTSLSANIASLERQMADLNKANDLLKTKVRLIVPWQLE